MRMTREQLTEELGSLTEELVEMIMNNDRANEYVLRCSELDYEHFRTSIGQDLPEEVRDELMCQYQVQAWNNLFRSLKI